MRVVTRFKRGLAVLMVTGALLAQAAPPAFASPDDDGVKKIDTLISGSGYRYTKLTPTVWSIDFTGKQLPTFKVLIAGGSLMVVFVTVARHDQFTMTPDLAKKLLNFDGALDQVKVGLDNDGDIFVRTDATVRVVDPEEFKVIVEQVAAATDEVYGGIKPMLTK